MDIFCFNSLGNPVLSNYRVLQMLKIKAEVEGQLELIIYR